MEETISVKMNVKSFSKEEMNFFHEKFIGHYIEYDMVPHYYNDEFYQFEMSANIYDEEEKTILYSVMPGFDKEQLA